MKKKTMLVIFLIYAYYLRKTVFKFSFLFQLTEEKEVIGTVVVRKRNSSSLPVQFELQGSDKFVIRYVISPLKEATKAEISLRQKLDYEKQNLYELEIYALV